MNLIRNIAAILVAFSTYAAPIDGLVTLRWDGHPTWTSSEMVRIYHSENLVQPMSSWVVIAEVPAKDLGVSVTVVPGPNFFAAKTVNFWGESDFSNVALTPPLPQGGANLRVTKGPK